MNRILKNISDAIYGTKRVRNRYQLAHPSETVLASDASKAIHTDSNDEIKRGPDWVTAKRAVVLLTKQKLVCGDWEIPVESIASAKLLKISSLLGSGQVLKVSTTTGEHYQFGMQLNPEWTQQQVLPMTLEKGHVQYSAFSVVVRIILVAYLLFRVYEYFQS